jgi:hypothetical protein
VTTGSVGDSWEKIINASNTNQISDLWFKGKTTHRLLGIDTPLKPVFRELSSIEKISNETLTPKLEGQWDKNLLARCGSDSLFVSLSQILDGKPVSLGFGASNVADNSCGIADYRRSDGKSLTLIGKEWDTREEADTIISAFNSYVRGRVDDPVEREEDRIVWKLKDGRTMVMHVNDNQTIWIFSPDDDTALKAWDALNI